MARVAVAGASGLVGTRLVSVLRAAGHDVTRLVRSPPGPGEVRWEPANGKLDAAELEGFDAIINLSGAGVADHRWTPEYKKLILDSRLACTGLLARAIASLRRPPDAFVSASAVGYYGNSGDAPVDENADAGTGFLADVCRAWEEAAQPAANATRIVTPRIGTVLSAAGGALARMLGPFRMGLGGPIAGGRQMMSWVALDDLVSILVRALTEGDLAGPVNAVSPQPVTNAEFTRTLGEVLGRPAILPLPAFAVRAMFGEMGDVLLHGQNVVPRKLLDAGHTFAHPTLREALRHALLDSPSGQEG